MGKVVKVVAVKCSREGCSTVIKVPARQKNWQNYCGVCVRYLA